MTTVQPVALKINERERTILVAIASGQTNKQIARSLGIRPQTVKNHLRNLFTKLDVDSRAAAVWQACRLRVLDVDAS